jgi:hypothetical protein
VALSAFQELWRVLYATLVKDMNEKLEEKEEEEEEKKRKRKQHKIRKQGRGGRRRW